MANCFTALLWLVFVFATPVLVFAQVQKNELLSQLESREKELFAEIPEFTLTVSRFETVVLEPDSIAVGRLNVLWKVSRKNANWAISRLFLETPSGVPVPNRPTFINLKNGEIFNWNSATGGATVMDFIDLYGVSTHFEYFKLAGLDAPRYFVMDSGKTWRQMDKRLFEADNWPWLSSSLKDNLGRYEVRESDGNSVLLRLNNGDEIVFEKISQSNNWVVTKRLLRSKPGTNSAEVFLSDYREVTSNVWIPFYVEHHVYADSKASQELQGKKVAISKYRVDEFSLDVDDDDIDRSLPPGITVSDMIRRMTYVTSNETDPFQGHVEDSKIIIAESSRWRIFARWMIAGLVGCLGSLLVFMLVRKWRQKNLV